MARRKRQAGGLTAASAATNSASGFAQGQGNGSYGLTAMRATSGQSGNTGTPPIVGEMKKRRNVQGGSLNFARRKRMPMRAKMSDAQRPMVSDRQYQFPALAPIPTQK